MKEQNKNDLLIKWKDTAEENNAMKEKYDSDSEKYSKAMVEQIKNNIKEQNELKAIN